MVERRTGRGRALALLVLFAPGAVVMASLVVACLVLVRYSFNAWDPAGTMVPAFTLASYERLFTDPVLRMALANTVRISATVTVICLVVAYPVALGIARSRWRNLLVFLVVTPLLTDVLVRTYGWIILLSQNGPINAAMTGLGVWDSPRRLLYRELAVVVELVHELIPFMILPIANVLERLDPALREAAMNLRAGPARTFLHVTLPLSAPGLLAGSLLVFALAMSAFSAPLLLGGGRVTTMTILIQQQMFTTLDWPRGSAQSILLVAVVLLILAGYRTLLRRASGGAA